MIEERILHFKTEIANEPVKVFFGAPGWIHIEKWQKYKAWHGGLAMKKVRMTFTLKDAMELCSAINSLNNARLKDAT